MVVLDLNSVACYSDSSMDNGENETLGVHS